MLAFSPGDAHLAVLCSLDRHVRAVRSVAFSDALDLIATCSFDGKTVVGSAAAALAAAEEEDEPQVLDGHENEVKDVAFQPRQVADREGGPLRLATCGRDKTVWVWSLDEEGEFEVEGVLSGHSQDVKSVRWHPSRNLLLSASYDDSIKLWNCEAAGGVTVDDVSS